MLRLRRLDRYVLSEVLGPTALGFLVYTSILLIQFLFRSAEMIIRRGLPAADVGKLLLFTVPNIVVLTIPMAFLFGILVAVGRLASDSELVAMRACGVSLFALYRPILLLSLGLTLVNVALMVSILPRGNYALQRLRLEILTQSVAQQVEPRVFYEEWEGLVLYVFEMPPGQKRWHGVFLAESIPGADNQVTMAEWGELRVEEGGERVVLELTNATTHELDFDDPGRYTTKRWDHLEQVVEDSFASEQQARISSSKGLRELTLGELALRLRDPEISAELRNLTRVEIHKKFSIPAACLVFGLIALPLGFNNRRGGRSSGFAISIVVILVYYVLITNGEEAARVGRLPAWFAMWSSNLLLTALGLVLMVRRNRDKSLLLSHVDRFWRTVVSGRWIALRQRWVARRERHEQRPLPSPPPRRGKPVVVLRLQLPLLRLRFPNLLDRYVARIFGGVFALVSVSAVAVYIIADLTESVDDILNNHIPARIVVDLYKYLSLQIFFDVAPILVLITTLITFALLSRTNEVVALRSLGVSLYRLAVPAVAASVLVALACVFLQSMVLPASNARAAELKDRISGREGARTYRRADQQWLFGRGRNIFNFLRFDEQEQELDRLQVFEFDESHAVSRRLFASRARYVGDRWVFADAWARSFDGPRTLGYRRFTEPVIADYPEHPDYFASEVRGPEQMAYGELQDYIDELEGRGQRVPELRVELYRKVAFPLAALVMALVALPFAFRLGKRGALYGVGLAVILGMVFLGIYAFFSTLGETGALPPVLAVWSPNAVFATLSVYLFLGVRT